MKWFPIGPDFVRDPRLLDPQRIAPRNLWGAQGRINCIAFEPPDGTGAPATTYVVVRDEMQLAAFRRRTTDRAWEPITDVLRRVDSNVDPFWLAVNPRDPSTIYVGTFNDRGIYISTTRGDTWSPKVPIAGRVRKLIVDPRAPAASGQTVLYAATDSGVFRSGDNGESWSQVLPGDVWSFCFRVDANGSPHFYAGLYQSGVWYACTEPLSAAAWSHINAMAIGLPPHVGGSSTVPENFNAVLVDCCAANPARAYAWFVAPKSPSSQTPAETVGLYTTGSPQTGWTLANPLPSMEFEGSLTPIHPQQGFDNFVFAVAPNSPGNGTADILFFGNLGNARSVDGGGTWKPVRQFFHNDMHGFAFYPDRLPAGAVPTFYIGSDGGLGANVQLADPSFAAEADLPDTQYNAGPRVFPSSGTFVNLNRGLQNSLVHVVGADAEGIAPPYLGCVDTGLNVKDGGLGWRSFGAGDSFELAVALGSDGVKLWEKIHLGNRKGMHVATDTGGNVLTDEVVATLHGEPDSVIMPTSPFVADGGGQCLVGALIEETVTTTTALVPAGDNLVVPVVSTAGIPEGQYLAIGTGPNRQAATATKVTPTSFEVSKIYHEKPAGSAVRLIRSAVARVDQAGVARRISQRSARRVRGLAFNPAATVRNIVCWTGTLWRVDEASTTSGPASWVDVSADRPPGADVASLAVGRSGDVYVLLLESAEVGNGDLSFETPLFRVPAAGTSWQALSCTGLPGTTLTDGTPQPFGRLVVDPVQEDVLYAIHGAEVYRLRRQMPDGSEVWRWSRLAEGLPGCWASDLWIGDLADSASPARKVVLRCGVLGRGVWETDVTAGATEPETDLFLRRHSLDQGWLKELRNGLANPYDPTRRIWHYQCADAKIDAPRLTSSGTFYQTDPEASGVDYSSAATPAGPISNVLFDLLRDDSRVVQEGTPVRLHVQVQNRSLTAADGVNVWVVYTPVAAGVPALGSRTDGSTFAFWNQFHADGSIAPSLPANSWWSAVGPPVTLDGIDAHHPEVASWSWIAPALAPGAVGHYCLGIFVHSAVAPVREIVRTSLDEIARTNKQVGQKNLHILEVSAGGSGGGSTDAVMDLSGVARDALSPIYVWFHNPTAEVRAARLVFDLRQLPADLEAVLRFPPLRTARPIAESLKGIARVERLGCLGALMHWLSRPFRFLARFLPSLLAGPTALPRLPALDPTQYLAEPSVRVELPDVHLDPHGAASARLDLRPAVPPKPGEELFFEVQQCVGEEVVGGATFVLRPPPASRPVVSQRPGQEEFGEIERVSREDPATYIPPWIRRIRDATR